MYAALALALTLCLLLDYDFVNRPLLVNSSFVTTPLFVGTLKTDASGAVTTTLSLPDNVGTFVVRVLVAGVDASTGLHSFGTGEVRVVSRRTLTLQAAMPRAVRIGDGFLGGVVVRVVDAPTSGTHTVVVTATVVQGAESVSMTSTGPVELACVPNVDVPARFTFASTGTAVASAVVRFTAAVVVGGVTVRAVGVLRASCAQSSVAVYV